ncbi:hypothetical protein ACFQZ1_18095 [Bacillus sp. CGMCC 1.60114]|uniref:hypothetical protein n=1 Tax=unclassified Bacillus (in: firmicutes) TaxID=185979 RepID=UPI00363F761F
MKKILGLALTTSLGLGLGFSNPTLAQVNQDSIHPNLEVKEMQDRRIQGINAADNLTPEQVNRLLEKMGFSITEISNMQDSLKKDIVKEGGKKAILTPLKNENTSHKPSVQYAYTEPEVVIENGLNFNLFALYEGTQGSNHIYKIYTNGIWTNIPYLKTNDTIGIFWGDNITAVNNSDSARQSWFTQKDELEANLKGDRSSIYGTQWKIPFKVGATLNGAYTSQKVSIPIQFTGQKFQVGSAFSHPWLTTQQDIPFKFGPGTVDFNNVKGNQYSLKYSITVGS